jgi:hypothetical protein
MVYGTPKVALDIIEVPFTDEFLEAAIKQQKMMHDKMEGFQSTINMNNDRDLLGFLGQASVVHKIREWGYEPKFSAYFNPALTGDDGDFEWRYEKCDVKASSVSKDFPKVYPNSRFLIKDKSEVKEVDRYVFCKVDIPKRVVLIAGCMNYNRFWRDSKPLESDKCKEPCHYVLAKDLDSFRKFIYA